LHTNYTDEVQLQIVSEEKITGWAESKYAPTIEKVEFSATPGSKTPNRSP